MDPTDESWVVYKENGKYGYKGCYGNVMIKAQFDQASPFTQGLAAV
ncbi:MAG TPA: WG repeat-containing protein [Tissierellia bacterium]|nr:WG repeat-containing protein [Tissierellia bacterium]